MPKGKCFPGRKFYIEQIRQDGRTNLLIEKNVWAFLIRKEYADALKESVGLYGYSDADRSADLATYDSWLNNCVIPRLERLWTSYQARFNEIESLVVDALVCNCNGSNCNLTDRLYQCVDEFFDSPNISAAVSLRWNMKCGGKRMESFCSPPVK